MVDYIVNFTDVNASPISIHEGDVNTTSTDIALFGKVRLEYGELLNESLLHLLEHFSCPEDSISPGSPDTTATANALLSAPSLGQFWHNSTTGMIHYWDGTMWASLRGLEDVAANWGTIGNKQQIPLPISSTTGYVFGYDECIWSIAPAGYDAAFNGMICFTDSQGNVTVEYRISGSDDAYDGYANYLIIGIRGNNNLGLSVSPPSLPDVTPSYTPTPTLTVTPTVTSTPTVTPTITPSPTIGVTPTITPTVTVTAEVTPSVSYMPLTPDVTLTITPTQTMTPTPSPINDMGTNARLYISPAVCDPGTPGPGGTLTKHYWTCGRVSKSAYDQSLYVSIQGIHGGVPPYRMDFQLTTEIHPIGSEPSGLESPYTSTHWEYAPFYVDDQTPSIIEKTYYGGTGGSGSTRTGVNIGEIVYVRLKFISARFSYKKDYSMTCQVRGKVVVTDAIGNQRQWWVPSSTPITGSGYVGGCPVGGTNLTGASALSTPYNSTLLWWAYSWGHKGTGTNPCGKCPNCLP